MAPEIIDLSSQIEFELSQQPDPWAPNAFPQFRDGDVEIKLEDIYVDMGSQGPARIASVPNNMAIPNMLPFALQIYHRVWPAKNENWRDDWHSFPLAFSAEDEIDWSKE